MFAPHYHTDQRAESRSSRRAHGAESQDCRESRIPFMTAADLAADRDGGAGE